jgi:hypothetical protein
MRAWRRAVRGPGGRRRATRRGRARPGAGPAGRAARAWEAPGRWASPGRGSGPRQCHRPVSGNWSVALSRDPRGRPTHGNPGLTPSWTRAPGRLPAPLLAATPTPSEQAAHPAEPDEDGPAAAAAGLGDLRGWQGLPRPDHHEAATEPRRAVWGPRTTCGDPRPDRAAGAHRQAHGGPRWSPRRLPRVGGRGGTVRKGRPRPGRRRAGRAEGADGVDWPAGGGGSGGEPTGA